MLLKQCQNALISNEFHMSELQRDIAKAIFPISLQPEEEVELHSGHSLGMHVCIDSKKIGTKGVDQLTILDEVDIQPAVLQSSSGGRLPISTKSISFLFHIGSGMSWEMIKIRSSFTFVSGKGRVWQQITSHDARLLLSQIAPSKGF